MSRDLPGPSAPGSLVRESGEFVPPKEIVSIEMTRLEGPGWLAFDADGIELHGRVADRAERISTRSLALAVVLAATAGASYVGPPEIWLTVGVLVAVGLVFRHQATASRTHRVPWSQVQHVVRMPAQPEVVCFVLERPLAGGGPETLFFAPIREDVSGWLAEVRRVAPASVPVDDESASLPSPVESSDVEGDEDEW